MRSYLKDELITHVQVLLLLTNHLRGKVAKLCLANSLNTCVTCVTTTKYIEYRLIFLSRVLVKFYCDVIARSCLQPMNTSINTFFSKLCDF